MRLFWAGFLLMGFILIDGSAYETRQAAAKTLTPEEIVMAREDGTPFPYPYPTPKPSPSPTPRPRPSPK